MTQPTAVPPSERAITAGLKLVREDIEGIRDLVASCRSHLHAIGVVDLNTEDDEVLLDRGRHPIPSDAATLADMRRQIRTLSRSGCIELEGAVSDYLNGWPE